jgi:hypothetical protein
LIDANSSDWAIWPPPLRVIDEVGQLLLGSAGLLARHLGAVPGTDPGKRVSRRGDAVDAAVGLSTAAQRHLFDTVAAIAVVIDAASAVVARVAVIGANATGVRSWVEDWAERGRAQQRRNEEVALRTVRAVRRAVVAQVIEDVDVDAVLARVDIDAVVARIDVAVLAQRLLDEVDVGQIVRDSSSTLAAETADAVRAESVRADRALGHLVGRVFRRNDDSDNDLEEVVTSPRTDDASGELNGDG